MTDPGRNVDVTVTLIDGADVDAVVHRLREAGMAVDQALGAVGIVTGSVAGDRRAALQELDGVAAVEEAQTFQLPPPDAGIQ